MGRWFWPFAVALLLASGTAWAAESTPRGATEAAGTQRLTLRNGLTLVLAPDSQATAVDVAVWYDAGSRRDRAGKTGLAHLFEHWMFRGSTKFGPGEHARRVRAEGGTSGAFITTDFTCFYQNLPPDALELALRLEADRMTGLWLTQATLDAERRSVPAERARRATPLSYGLERIYGMAYPTHPYRNSVFGRSADLSKLTLADAQEFYRRHYGPANAVVTIVGRFDPTAAASLARKHFEPLKAGTKSVAAAPAEKEQTSERRAFEAAAIPGRTLMAAWRLPPRTDPRWPAVDLLSILLAQGQSSRLTRALVQEHSLSPSVQGDVESRKEESLFFVFVPVLQKADTAEVERRLFGEIGRLTFEPVSAQELEKAKRQAEVATWLGLQTSRGRAQAIGHSVMLAGDADDYARHIERIRAVTPEDVTKAAYLLDAAKREVLWMAPVDAGGRP
jgi:zinc protease